MMAAWLVVIYRLHIPLTRENPRRPSTGWSSRERREITNAPLIILWHDSAVRYRDRRRYRRRRAARRDHQHPRRAGCDDGILPRSTLPGDLRAVGYDVRDLGDGERIQPPR